MSLPTEFQQFIHLSRYARWVEEAGRRETWEETVKRYFDFFEQSLKDTCDYTLDAATRNELETAVLNLEIMPSMRALMAAGPALARENIAGYNCAFVGIDRPRVFDEILYILMNGTGVGFSVEDKYLDNLPVVSDEFHPTETTIVVSDSKLGWAKALKQLISMLYVGEMPRWDTSRIRAAGSPLKTFGGRASGPEPLETLFEFATETFRAAAGRKLKPIEAHDLVCKIAEIVVVGGVRRSALISLSDLGDGEMRKAKSGAWWEYNIHRALSNNSAVYQSKPDVYTFMKEWIALYESKSGERGIFNAEAAKKKVASLVDIDGNPKRSPDHDWGINPCSEIILRSKEFCNLSEVIVRDTDTFESLERKVRLATILGTFQATLTNFNYLSSAWSKNCNEERLLGVSLTGIMDNKFTNGKHYVDDMDEMKGFLRDLRQVSIKINAEWADKLGINRAAATTAVKPSGTVSLLADSSSGIHTRHNPHYIRTVRIDNKDPLCKFMTEEGFPNEPDITKPEHTTVFSFPMASPKNSIFRNDMTAIEQLEMWLVYAENWCEHKPSVTISVKEDEWIEVASFVYKHFDHMSGVSFLPFADHVYQQAPYQDIDEDTYKEWVTKMPENVEWGKLSGYETSDLTVGAQTAACSSGICELVDIT